MALHLPAEWAELFRSDTENEEFSGLWGAECDKTWLVRIREDI